MFIECPFPSYPEDVSLYPQQVTYNATLLGEDRRSIPRSVTQQFRPLSFPENIVVTSTCLVGDRTSSKLSLELSISWEHPQTEGDISSYDIYFSTGDNILRHFDFFGNSDETLRVPGHLTRFTGNFSVTFTDINPANPLPPQPIVQVNTLHLPCILETCICMYQCKNYHVCILLTLLQSYYYYIFLGSGVKVVSDFPLAFSLPLTLCPSLSFPPSLSLSLSLSRCAPSRMIM